MRVPQLSDKNLKILLVVVLFITIVVALITLTKTKVAPITGAVSGTANTDLTISNYIAVNVEGAIEFGPGQVNPLNVTAELDASPAGGIINGTWVDVNQSIRVRNDGNIMINLSVKSSQAAATWIGPNSETYFIAINATDEDGCGAYLNGRTLYNGTMWVQNRSAWTTLDTAYRPVCTNLSRGVSNPPNLNDEVNFTVRLVVNKNAVPGRKTVTLTFLGDDY